MPTREQLELTHRRRAQFSTTDSIAAQRTSPVLDKNNSIVKFARPHLKMSVHHKLIIPSTGSGRFAVSTNPKEEKTRKIILNDKTEHKLETRKYNTFSLRSLMGRQCNRIPSFSTSRTEQPTSSRIKSRSSLLKTNVSKNKTGELESEQSFLCKPSHEQGTKSKNSATALPKTTIPGYSVTKQVCPRQSLIKSSLNESDGNSSSRTRSDNKSIQQTTSRRNSEVMCSSCRNIIPAKTDRTTEEELAALSDAIGNCRLRIQKSKETHENQQMDLLEINEVLDFEQKEIDERQKRLAAYETLLEERSLQAKNLESEINSLILKTMKESRGRHGSASLSKESIPSCLTMETCEDDCSEFQKQITELIEEMNLCIKNDRNWNSEIFAEKLEAICKNNTIDSCANLIGRPTRSTSEPRMRSNKFLKNV